LSQIFLPGFIQRIPFLRVQSRILRYHRPAGT
jgi:hypothetical protein